MNLSGPLLLLRSLHCQPSGSARFPIPAAFVLSAHGEKQNAPEKGRDKTKGKSMNSDTNKPAQQITLGTIKAAIWKNTTPTGDRFNVTFERLYKDGVSWKSSNNFGRDDLLVLGKVADKAHDWIFAAQREGKE